jgi:hypothetical protein
MISTQCETVVEENTILINGKAFGEASKVNCQRPRLFCESCQEAGVFFSFHISYSSIDTSSAAHARISGPYANRGNIESREQTILSGSWIQQCYL